MQSICQKCRIRAPTGLSKRRESEFGNRIISKSWIRRIYCVSIPFFISLSFVISFFLLLNFSLLYFSCEENIFHSFIGKLGPGQVVGRQTPVFSPLGEIEVKLGFLVYITSLNISFVNFKCCFHS